MTQAQLRVLIVADGYPPDNCGGAAMSTEAICNGLRARGHRVLVITHGRHRDRPWVFRIASGPVGFMVRLIRYGWAVAEAFGPDVIEFSGPVGVLMLARPKLLGCRVPPTVGVVRGLVDQERLAVRRQPVDRDLSFGPDLQQHLFRFVRAPTMMALERLRARWCDHIAFVSAAAQAGWQRRYGRVARSCVLYNPVDTDFWRPDSQAGARLRQRLGLETAGIVLYAGVFRAVKGLDVLLRAMPQVVRHRPEAVLVVAGGRPDQQDQFRRLADRLGLDTHVRFLGWLDSAALRECFQAADVVALPSRYDAFPLTVLEAMSCGRCVVASDVGGVSEAICRPDLGCTVPPERADLLAGSLIRILGDVAGRQAMGEAARRHVVERHSLARMVDARLSLYRSLLRAR
jgi:glycosyltransferase involved in cell wall biosynthesis